MAETSQWSFLAQEAGRARSQVQVVAQQQREQLLQSAQEAQEALGRQRSAWEEETQAVLKEVREVGAKEVRLRELPGGATRGMRQQIVEIEQKVAEGSIKLQDGKRQIERIKEQELAKIEKAKQDAERPILIELSKSLGATDADKGLYIQPEYAGNFPNVGPIIEFLPGEWEGTRAARALVTNPDRIAELRESTTKTLNEFKEAKAKGFLDWRQENTIPTYEKILQELDAGTYTETVWWGPKNLQEYEATVKAIQEKAKVPPVAQATLSPSIVVDETGLVKVRDGYVGQAEFDALSSANQKLIKELGVSGFNKRLQSEFEQKIVKEYGTAGWSVLTPEGQKAFAEAWKSGRPASEALQEAVKMAAAQSFVKANTKVNIAGEDVYINKDYYDSLSSGDRQLLATVGLEKFQSLIQEKLSGLKDYTVPIRPDMSAGEIKESATLSDKSKAITLFLYYPEDYKKWAAKEGISLQSLGISASALKPVETFDIARFLRENPKVESSTLVAAGFDKESIGNAVAYNKQSFIMANPIEAYNKALKDAGYYDIEGDKERRDFLSRHPELQKLKQEADNWLKDAPKQPPDLSLQAFKASYLVARGIDPKKVDDAVSPFSEIAKLRGEAQEVYTRLYGMGATQASIGVAVASTVLFSPARVLYPEVKAKDISGLEWGVGVAQAAFVATGVAGVVAKGISAPALTMLRSTQIAASAFLTPVSVYGTIKNWDEMSPLERGVSVGFDVIVALPLVMGGVSAARILAKRIDPIGTAAKDLLKVEKMTNETFAKNLKDAYGSEVANKFRVVNKAQTDYMSKLVKLEKLETGKTPDAIKIDATRKIADASGRHLEEVAIDYVGSLKSATTEISTGKYQLVRVVDKAGNLVKYERVPAAKGKIEVGIGFDSPTVARMLDDLPREIARNARSIVKSLRPSDAEIARLKADVLRTATRLREAQEKFPSDPSKWSDLIYDNAIAQSKLAQAQIGDVVKLQGDLLRLRSRLPKATEAELKQLSALERQLKVATSGAEVTKLEISLSELSTRIYNSRLFRAPASLRVGIQELESELAKVVKSMEVEWGRGGPVTRGRGRVGIAPSSAPGGTALAEIKELRPKADIYGEVLVARAVETPWGKFGLIVPRPPTTPEVGTPITKPALPDIIITEPHLLVKTKTIPRPEAPPEVEPKVWPIHPPIRIEPYPEIEPYVWPLPEAEPYTKGIEFVEQPQVSPATKAALEAATKANTRFLEELKTATEAAVKKATRLAVAGKTGTALETAVATSVSTQVKNLTRIQPALRSQLLMQVKPITRLAVETATQVAQKIKVRPWTPITVKLPDGTKHTLTEEERAGAVGWKQGFIYKLWFPPYGQNNIANTRKPIPGVPYYSGPESAYRSIVRLGGKVPPEIKRDMGIMDITVRTPKEGRPKLAFRLDRYQRTQTTPGPKRAKLARHKPKRRQSRSMPVLVSAR